MPREGLGISLQRNLVPGGAPVGVCSNQLKAGDFVCNSSGELGTRLCVYTHG